MIATPLKRHRLIALSVCVLASTFDLFGAPNHQRTSSREPQRETNTEKPYTELSTYTEFLNCMNQGKYILVKFHAAWCEGCKEVEPAFMHVCHTHADTVIPVAIDLDNQYLYSKVQHYVERGIPTIVLLDQNGKELTKQIGSSDAETLERALAPHITSARRVSQEQKSADKAADKARDLPTVRTYHEYRNIVQQHPNVAILLQADWCSPCKMFLSTFADFASQYTDVYCCLVSIDDIHEDAQLQNELASYAKDGIPTTVFILDGIPQTYISGSYPLNLVKRTAERNLRIASPSDHRSQTDTKEPHEQVHENSEQTKASASSEENSWFNFGKRKKRRRRRK